jgi:hypothetical protein
LAFEVARRLRRKGADDVSHALQNLLEDIRDVIQFMPISQEARSVLIIVGRVLKAELEKEPSGE